MADCDAVSSLEVPRSIEGVVVTSTTSSSSSSSTTANASANKSSRKRKKKKKKKKKPTSAEPLSSDDESEDFVIPLLNDTMKTKKTTSNSIDRQNRAPSSTSNISTPQEVLRRQLIEKDGYEAAQIEQAMEEMWDKGLPFDEYESVVHYLQNEYAMTLSGGGTASTASNSMISDSTNPDEEEERDLASQTQYESLGPEEPEEKDEVITATVASNEDIPSVIEENECEIEEEEEERTEKEANEEENSLEKPPSTCSMAAKLNVVASYENLTDAIFALTQWVKLAASNDEIEFFCRAETTSALPTVIRRGISAEIDDTIRFESAVQPALVRLLMGVLNRCGIDELGASLRDELKEKMEDMLEQARKVLLLTSDEDNENMIGERVSRFIVSRLAIAMDEKNKFEKIHKNCSNVLYEDDLTMAAMLALRDDVKSHAMRASNKVQSSMERIFSVEKESSRSSSASARAFEIDDITLHIVDQDTKSRFDRERSRLQELKTQVRGGGEKVQCLRESLRSLETKRRGYQDKIAELRATLEELEAQENDASIQIESLSTQLVQEELNDIEEAKKLEEDVARTEEAVRYGNLVSGLAGTMKSYGKSIEKATTSKTVTEIQNGDSNETSSDEFASKTAPITEASTLQAMEDYLSKTQKYFLKEAHCFTQLKNRLATKTAEVKDLRSELDQYNRVKDLFATSIIPKQINQAIERNERLIQAYKGKLVAYADDGRLMYETLLSRLETYSASASTIDLASLFPFELSNGVVEAIRLLEIFDLDCKRLAPFVKENSEPSKVATAPVAVDSTALSTKPKGLALKLNWADTSSKKNTGTTKEPKKSLLDIQNEELRAKSKSNTMEST